MTRRLPVLAVGVVLLGTLSACGLPTSPDVHVVRRILTDQQSDDSVIRRIAPGPATDATPEQIVRGFFAAESNDDDQHAVARQFLERTSSWDSTGSTDVYDETSPIKVAIAGGGDGRSLRATISFERTGRIEPDGSFIAEVGTVQERMTLRQVNEQWRLSDVPRGLQLSSRDVARSYVSATIWFLSRDPSRPRLVPDVRLLPTSSAGLPSSLVRALLAGPSALLAPLVQTAFPSGTQLQGSAVLVDGEAAVDLSSEAATARGTQRDHLLAQLAQTMTQVTGAQRLRVTSSGRGLAGADPEVGTLSSLTRALDPTGDDAPAKPPTAFGIADGVLETVSATETSVKATGWTRVSGLIRVVGDPDSQRIVARQRVGSATSVLLGGVATRPAQVLAPDQYDAVTITPDGYALAHRAGARAALIRADARSSVEVALPEGLPASSIAAMAMARDGVHLALAVRSGGTTRLQLAGLTGGARPSLVLLGPTISGVSGIVDLSWASATHVLVIGATDSGTVRALDVLIDGSDIAPLSSAGLPGNPRSIAGWPGSKVLVIDDGRAWALGSGWTTIGHSSDITYA